MTIYLCVKTHAITGLKYLCKTTKNPFNYSGSGKDWLPHLKKYGPNHKTEIIKECEDIKEFEYWGRHYSKLWNVVKGVDDFGNKIWANKIPETGGGPGGKVGRKDSDETIAKRKNNMPVKRIFGTDNPKARIFKFIDPLNQEVIVSGNLVPFCKEHNLCVEMVYRCIRGTKETYKGWKISRL